MRVASFFVLNYNITKCSFICKLTRSLRLKNGFIIFESKHDFMSQSHTYRILLKEEPEGGYTVTVPALPGCITYGEDLNQALEMAKEAIEGYIELLKEI